MARQEQFFNSDAYTVKKRNEKGSNSKYFLGVIDAGGVAVAGIFFRVFTPCGALCNAVTTSAQLHRRVSERIQK